MQTRRTPILSALGAVLVLTLVAPAWADGLRGDFQDAMGPRFGPSPKHQQAPRHRPMRRGADLLDQMRYWNEVAINASGLDHTPVGPGEPRVFGEQLGPGRSSRAMAIVHIAIFEAVNAIVGGYESHIGLRRAST